MLRKTMIVLATAAALTGGLTADAFARGGGGGHGGGVGGGAGRGAIVRDPTILFGAGPAQTPTLNPIPSPLGRPAQAPTINGPISQPAFRGLTGMGE